MKKLLLILCLITSCISYAQSNSPACNGDNWNNCYGERSQFGEKYIGQWKNNLYHGQGTLTFSMVGKYIGQWKDGKYHGHGTLILSNGEKYEGAFKDDLFHGFGIYYNPNGTIRQKGLWKDGEFVKVNIANESTIESNAKEYGISDERKKLEEERRQLAEERRKLEEEKRKFNTKPPVNNTQDNKRQRCINLGLAPNSADFQQCMK